MRENFNPRARWRAAIAGARALHRFGSSASKLSSDSKTSGGWKSSFDSDDDDDDDDELTPGSGPSKLNQLPPGDNQHVQVTPSSEDPPQVGQLKREHEDHEPLHQQVPLESQDSTKTDITRMHEEPAVNRQGTSDSDMILQMPGSFHFPTSKKREGADESEGWTHLLQKLHLRT